MNNTLVSSQEPLAGVDRVLHYLPPNFDEAKRFLKLLAPDEDVFTFQTVPDIKEESKNPKIRAALNRVYHGTLEENFIHLSALNICLAGVFVMINRGDGLALLGHKTCRSNANVVGIRSIFADLDGAPLEPVLAHSIHPDIVVESSPGKWHAYWLAKGCPLDEFTRLQEAVATNFNGDHSIKDLARVMRVPGFWHQKRDPFMTRIVYPA